MLALRSGDCGQITHHSQNRTNNSACDVSAEHAHAQSPRVHNYVAWLLRTPHAQELTASCVWRGGSAWVTACCPLPRSGARVLPRNVIAALSRADAPAILNLSRLSFDWLPVSTMFCSASYLFSPTLSDSRKHDARSFSLDDHMCGYPNQLRVLSSVKC